MRHTRRRRKNRGHARRSHRRVGRRSHRRTRRNKGKYSSFVKKHKGLFKRMGFKGASRKIAAMWRRR